MARTYAGIMALVGMNVVLLRAIKGGAGLDATIILAWVWMALLGVVGLAVGAIAESTIEQAVLEQMERQLATTEDAK